MYPELIARLNTCKERVTGLREAVAGEDVQARVTELEAKRDGPGFWDNNDAAQEVIAEVKRLRAQIDPVLELTSTLNDLLELAELAEAEGDATAEAELRDEAQRSEQTLERLELTATLSEPHDAANAYLSLQAGAGGTESCDWAAMLARMYQRFCERHGFTVKEVDLVAGEEAGIRSSTLHVAGTNAYGYLRAEVGVHRLVRISPYDAKNRRHTSFAAVDVIPELPDASKSVEVNEADLRIDTYRAGGAGGQHVNKVDSAVRITHIPTGLVVQCQNERSQHSNKSTAMKMLKAKMVREEERKREAELEKKYGNKSEIAFGSQIRSYVLHPYTIVKDLRTEHEVGNAEGVLDGKIMPFIEAFLRWKLKRKK